MCGYVNNALIYCVWICALYACHASSLQAVLFWSKFLGKCPPPFQGRYFALGAFTPNVEVCIAKCPKYGNRMSVCNCVDFCAFSFRRSAPSLLYSQCMSLLPHSLCLSGLGCEGGLYHWTSPLQWLFSVSAYCSVYCLFIF